MTPELKEVVHETLLGAPSHCIDAHHYAMSQDIPGEVGSTTGFSNPALACATYLEWDVTSGFTLQGELEFNIVVSCENLALSTTGATFTHRIIMQKNGESIGDSYDGAAGENACMGELVWAGTVPNTGGTVFEEGDLLALRVIHWYLTPPAQTNNFHFISGQTYVTNPGIPAPALFDDVPSDDEELPPAPTTFEENLTDASVQIAHSFTEETSDKYIFTWNTDASAWTISYVSTQTAGEVKFSVLDGDGVGVYEGTITAGSQASEYFDAVAPGAWTIELDYTSFVGDFTFAVEPGVVADEAPAADEPPAPVDNTQDEPEEAPKSTPMGFVLPAMGLLGLAALRRR